VQGHREGKGGRERGIEEREIKEERKKGEREARREEGGRTFYIRDTRGGSKLQEQGRRGGRREGGSQV
jgi:hypothetical protein